MSNLATKLANDIHDAVLTKLAGTPLPVGNPTPHTPAQQSMPKAPSTPSTPKPAVNAGALTPQAAPMPPKVNNGTAPLGVPPAAQTTALTPKPNMGQRPQAMSEATANLLRSKGYKPNAFSLNSDGNWSSTPPQLIAGSRG